MSHLNNGSAEETSANNSAFYENIPGLASRLGIAPRTVQAWMKQGRIPYLRFGRLTRFIPRKVAEALEKGFSIEASKGGSAL